MLFMLVTLWRTGKHVKKLKPFLLGQNMAMASSQQSQGSPQLKPFKSCCLFDGHERRFMDSLLIFDKLDIEYLNCQLRVYSLGG
jgi:hypothetical protein